MTLEHATQIAQSIIGPAGLLGYLVGRGSWWPSEALLKDAKHAVGRVMADAYQFCRPIWGLHPKLDPATNRDPLRLTRRPNTLSDTPDDLRSVLEQMQAATQSMLPAMVAAFPAAGNDLVTCAAAIVEGAARTERLISEAARSTR